MNNTYVVKPSAVPVDLSAAWDSPMWQNANELKLENSLPRGGDFRPDTRIKMLYDNKRICGLFKVDDQYVVARATANQQQVCQDSCVEFFVWPHGAPRYFNFEMNCGGTILLYHIKADNTKEYDLVPESDLATIERYHTLPSLITEEITEPVTWYLGFGIPIEFFRKYSGISPELSGQTWKANFTKCADKCSHPFWLTWKNLSKSSFHLPYEFGSLYFE